jgi:uncharacterized protein YhaN
VTKEQEMFYLHELSTGTKDQLMMAVRFAFLADNADLLKVQSSLMHTVISWAIVVPKALLIGPLAVVPLVDTLTKEQEMFYLHELSTGTKDQLMMAVRFAFLAVQGEQLICPIIIDDTISWSEEKQMTCCF